MNTQRTRRDHRTAKSPIPAYRASLSPVAAKALRTASIIAVDHVFEDLHVLGEPGYTFDDGLLGMLYPQPRLPRYTRQGNCMFKGPVRGL